jgi:protocatechuate 3,4-dioxygenase beta subunit
MPLHSQTAFREIIKHHATAGKLTIVTASEPGKKIKVKAVIKNQDGAPVNDALVYVYQTSDKGW